jgi:uncharacterized membrane protein YfcA
MIRGLDPTLFTLAFLLSTFVAGTVVGLAGFAFGLVASGIWLYILTPVQTATMILVFGFLVQSYAVWVQRSALDWRRVWPLVLGSALGIPVGIAILTTANPSHLRIGVGALLVLYSIYNLARPAMKPVIAGGVPADIGAGVVNGIIGGTTGLAGVAATIWCQFRGGPRDQQRAVFQPVGVASFIMCAAWLGGRGEIPPDTGWLVLLGLPALIVGCWLGWKLYGRLDEAQFRKVVLILLLVSGTVLMFGR